MRLPPEKKETQYRTIYEVLYRNPRAYEVEIASALKSARNTARTRVREAYTKGYVTRPGIEKRSYSNFRELMYFLRCQNPQRLFHNLMLNQDVVFQALMTGFSNLWVIARRRLDLSECVLQGVRSDYYVPYTPDCTWEYAIRTMRERIVNFGPDRPSSKIIGTHWHEEVTWDQECERLFQEFHHNLTRSVLPIVRRTFISHEKCGKWLRNISDYCTVVTCHYPKAVSAYDPYLFMVETKYEDFVVKVFSEVPTTVWFFRVAGVLFFLVHVRRDLMRVVYPGMSLRDLEVPFLMREFLSRGIIRSEAHALVEYWCGR